MKTQDVLKTGIDRNFLRKCEYEKLICPKRTDNEWIIDKEYIPREYSQEEVEIVWNAYLYRKMGLSYKQIKGLINGEKIGVRNSLNELIQKYERQIEELQVLIEFMRYVKGIGFVPTLPNQLMGSSSFKDYLTDLIEHIDKDRRIKKVLEVVEYASNVDNIEDINSNEIEHMQSIYDDLCIDKEFGDAYTGALVNLVENMYLEPSSNKIQSIVEELFYYHKKLNNDESISAWNFASGYIFVHFNDSDLSAMLKKAFGEEAVWFISKAMIEFLKVKEPMKIQEMLMENR